MTGGPVAESRALTGLRGVAALLVMVHHFYLHLALGEHLPPLQWLLRKGYLGVDLFFVLSGFVLSMVYGAWFDGSRALAPVDLARFLARRVARVWPLHAATILLVLLPWHDGLAVAPLVTWRTVAANLAMVQAWGVSASINPPAWSVSAEFGAYLLFPALAALGLRSRAGGWACAVLAAALLAYCLLNAPPLGLGRRGPLDLYRNYSVLPLLRCVSGVLLGILAWRLGQVRSLRALAATAWLGPAALLLAGALMLGRVHDLLILPLLPVAVLGMHFGRGPGHAALARGPLHALGLLSYAVYLLHFLILDSFPFALAPLPAALLAFLAVTLGWAALFHRFLEEPARRSFRLIAERVLRARVNSPN